MWGEPSATSSKTLQRLQNRAARIVLRRDSSKDTFNVLGWAELETKWKRHKCVLVYKCLNNPQQIFHPNSVLLDHFLMIHLFKPIAIMIIIFIVFIQGQ